MISPRRRWSFSLRTLFVVVTGIAILAAVFAASKKDGMMLLLAAMGCWYVGRHYLWWRDHYFHWQQHHFPDKFGDEMPAFHRRFRWGMLVFIGAALLVFAGAGLFCIGKAFIAPSKN